MKMKRLRLFFFPLILGVCLAVLYFTFFGPPIKKPSSQYSVILYQYTDNDWTSLTEGIKQAAEDEGVVVNYVLMTPGDSSENQASLIRREAENGTQGILLAPVDSELLLEQIELLDLSIPVLTVETGLGEYDADISGDNYEMGYLLGCKVAEDMQLTQRKTVRIIREYTERQSIRQRYNGFTDALTEKIPGAQMLDCQRSEGDYSLALYIANLYNYSGHDAYLIALDKYCTEALIDASSIAELTTESQELFCRSAFGIGNTEKTVSGLDSGKLRGLVYQNEFHMGYQGLQSLILKSHAKKNEPTAKIKYYYATRETLYEPENQRLLFPLK